jgi:hypothetical protein
MTTPDEREIARAVRIKLTSKTTWTSRDGTTRNISELRDGHLCFIILKMKRTPGWRESQRERIKLEFELRKKARPQEMEKCMRRAEAKASVIHDRF